MQAKPRRPVISRRPAMLATRREGESRGEAAEALGLCFKPAAGTVDSMHQVAPRRKGQGVRAATAVIAILLAAPQCQAQWYTGWYGGWSGEGSTPYSSAVKAHANLVAAEGQAAESYARAAAAAEQARAQYLENQARYVEWRRQQQWITEERRAARLAAMRAKAARRPAPRAPTDLYPPLAPDQLDRLTGEIHWPPCLMDTEYAADRKIVEGALQTRAETGPDERTSSILHDAAWRMLAHSAPSVRRLDSQEHLACRRFLKSLMLEGQFSPGVLR